MVLVPFQSVLFKKYEEDKVLWELWETRSLRFPRSGGRVLCVHGSDSFHRRGESFDTIRIELGHLAESATKVLRLECQTETCASVRWTVRDIQWEVAPRAPVQG
jgi:hypothetical protein